MSVGTHLAKPNLVSNFYYNCTPPRHGDIEHTYLLINPQNLSLCPILYHPRKIPWPS